MLSYLIIGLIALCGIGLFCLHLQSKRKSCCVKSNMRFVKEDFTLSGTRYRYYKCTVCNRKQLVYPYYGDPYK